MTWIAKPAEPQPGRYSCWRLCQPGDVLSHGSVKIAVRDPKWLRSRRTKRSDCWRNAWRDPMTHLIFPANSSSLPCCRH